MNVPRLLACTVGNAGLGAVNVFRALADALAPNTLPHHE